MRQLTHVPAPNRSVADIGYTRQAKAAPPPSDKDCDGSAQPVAPGALVRIYDLEKEWGFPFWLCPLGAREKCARERWSVRKHRAPPFDDLPCYEHRDGGACGV